MVAALDGIPRKHPAHLVAAVPVAPFEILADLRSHCDEVICLETPSPFCAVGDHYADFA